MPRSLFFDVQVGGCQPWKKWLFVTLLHREFSIMWTTWNKSNNCFLLRLINKKVYLRDIHLECVLIRLAINNFGISLKVRRRLYLELFIVRDNFKYSTLNYAINLRYWAQTYVFSEQCLYSVIAVSSWPGNPPSSIHPQFYIISLC